MQKKHDGGGLPENFFLKGYGRVNPRRVLGYKKKTVAAQPYGKNVYFVAAVVVGVQEERAPSPLWMSLFMLAFFAEVLAGDGSDAIFWTCILLRRR